MLALIHSWGRLAPISAQPSLQFGIQSGHVICSGQLAATLRTPEFSGLVRAAPAKLGSLTPMRVGGDNGALQSAVSLNDAQPNSPRWRNKGFDDEVLNFTKKTDAYLRSSNSLVIGHQHAIDGTAGCRWADAYRLHAKPSPAFGGLRRYLNFRRVGFYMALNGGIDRANHSGNQAPKTKMSCPGRQLITEWLASLETVSATWPQIWSKKPCAVSRPVHPEIQQENRSLSPLTFETSSAFASPCLPPRLRRLPGEIRIGSERIGLRDIPPAFASN